MYAEKKKEKKKKKCFESENVYPRVPINRPPKQFYFVATINACKLKNQTCHQFLQENICHMYQ
jgi:hypothetical protein